MMALSDGLFWVMMGAIAAPFVAWKTCLKVSGAIAILVLGTRWALGYNETAVSAAVVVACSGGAGFGVVSAGLGIAVLAGMMSAK